MSAHFSELVSAASPDSSGSSRCLTAEERRTAVLLKPAIVWRVRLTEWTSDDHLRHPAFEGSRRRIAEQLKGHPARVFTTLAHLMDEDFLTEAFHQLRKDAAAGIKQ